MTDIKKHTNKIIQAFQWALIGAFILSMAGCQKDTEGPKGDERGDLIKSTYYLKYSAGDIRSILDLYDVEVNVNIQYDVSVYKILYYTPGPDGSLLKASGALMVPDVSEELPAINFHHGTETKRNLVASVSPIITGEGVAGLVSASLGFVSFLPDYLGLGDSDILHPYLHAGLSAGSVIDLLRAGNTFCEESGILLNHDLYLGGYSEGGYVTLAAQREIEEQLSFAFHIVACAPQAGPYDLYETALYFLNLEEYPEPVFLAYMLTAYNDIYKWNRLAEIFNEPYAGEMPDLFDGTHTNGEISSALPTKINELIKQSFMDGIKDGSEKDFLDALKENTLLDWTPQAPIRFYHSNGDEVVPYQNMLTAARELRENGATKIETVTIEGMKHSQASLPAVTQMIEWFDSLKMSR